MLRHLEYCVPIHEAPGALVSGSYCCKIHHYKVQVKDNNKYSFSGIWRLLPMCWLILGGSAHLSEGPRGSHLGQLCSLWISPSSWNQGATTQDKAFFWKRQSTKVIKTQILPAQAGGNWHFQRSASWYGPKQVTFFFVFLFFFLIFIYLFLERRRGEGEKHWCERETSISCLLYVPHLGPESPTQVCTLIKNQTTFRFAGRCPAS